MSNNKSALQSELQNEIFIYTRAYKIQQLIFLDYHKVLLQHVVILVILHNIR